VQTFRWQHRDWAVAVRETITDTPMVAIASSVVWGAVGADPEGMPELLARLDPTAPGLAERDIALVRLAAIVGAGWSTTGTVDAVPAVEWTLEADPRCEDLVTEGWLLFNLLTQTLHDPDPRIVARAHRAARSGPSPTLRGASLAALHGYRFQNPKLTDGFDVGDAVEGLLEAIAVCREAGDRLFEAVATLYLMMPLAARGALDDAPLLEDTLRRLRELRYGIAIDVLAAPLGVWLARVGRPEPAAVLAGYLEIHRVRNPVVEPVADQLEKLLADAPVAAHRARGVAMTRDELTDYLDSELAASVP
jgi:hypothetical protein